MLLQDGCLRALIYYLAVSYVQFSRGAFLPAVSLRSLCVQLLLYSDLDVVPTHMLLLSTECVFTEASMRRGGYFVFVSMLSDTKNVHTNVILLIASLLTTNLKLESSFPLCRIKLKTVNSCIIRNSLTSSE